VIAGILNVTPDSFSDGGHYLDPERAVSHAEALVAEGASLLDVGAESTRPGRPEPVPLEEEWRRLAPVLSGLARRLPDTPVTVDTVKAEVARRALAEGAWAINDVSGLRADPEIANVCASHGAGLILMHSRGSVTDMATYDHAEYEDVAGEVVAELEHAVAVAVARGVAREVIVLDPGLGFSKTPEQTVEVLRRLDLVVALGRPVMVGPSRKRFLGHLTGLDVAQRDVATAAACMAAYAAGARLFRVHAPAPTRDALQVAAAVWGG
jgi:dihydropteroate synthase